MTPANIKTATLRGISLFVAIAFTVTTLIWDPSTALASMGSLELQAQVKFQKELQSYLYSMPEEIGSIAKINQAPGLRTKVLENDKPVRDRGPWNVDPFFVLIQDAHANPEGQQNVASMLQYLVTKYPDLAIGLEGAAGELHPEYLNLFKEFPEANRAVIEDLKQKGELNGAEIYLLEKHRGTGNGERGMENEKPQALAVSRLSFPSVFGIENAALYRDNLKTYRDLLFKRDEIQTQLNPVRAELEKESSKKLSGELRDFLKERSRRKEGKFSLTGLSSDSNLQAYVRYLQKQSLKLLKVDLKDPIEQLRFPNLLRVVMLEETLKGYDAGKVQNQWAEAIRTLRAAAKTADEKAFVEAFAAFGLKKGYLSASLTVDRGPLTDAASAALYPRKLLEGLFLFGQTHKLSFTGQEAFWQSWKLAVFQAEIDVAELLLEMTTLENGLIQKLVRSEDEKTLVRKIENFDLLEKMLRLELSRPEYEKVFAGREALNDFVKSSANLRKALDKAYYFYEVSLKRDRVLVENALGERGTGNGYSAGNVERGTDNVSVQRFPLAVPRVIVLYTGGFHTPGIETILRQKGIGYAVFSPRITKTDHGEMYQNVMADANADLSAYFKVKNPFATKQEALFFKQLIETAAPVLSEKYQMIPGQVAASVAQAVSSSPVFSGTLKADQQKDQLSTVRFTPEKGPGISTSQNSAVMPIPATIGRAEAMLLDPMPQQAIGQPTNVTFSASASRILPTGTQSETGSLRGGRSEMREEEGRQRRVLEFLLYCASHKAGRWPSAKVAAAFQPAGAFTFTEVATNTLGVHRHAEIQMILNVLSKSAGKVRPEWKKEYLESLKKLWFLTDKVKIDESEEARFLLGNLSDMAGSPFNGGTLYVTLHPCPSCMRTLGFILGLKEIIYTEEAPNEGAKVKWETAKKEVKDELKREIRFQDALAVIKIPMDPSMFVFNNEFYRSNTPGQKKDFDALQELVKERLDKATEGLSSENFSMEDLEAARSDVLEELDRAFGGLSDPKEMIPKIRTLPDHSVPGSARRYQRHVEAIKNAPPVWRYEKLPTPDVVYEAYEMLRYLVDATRGRQDGDAIISFSIDFGIRMQQKISSVTSQRLNTYLLKYCLPLIIEHSRNVAEYQKNLASFEKFLNKNLEMAWWKDPAQKFVEGAYIIEKFAKDPESFKDALEIIGLTVSSINDSVLEDAARLINGPGSDIDLSAVRSIVQSRVGKAERSEMRLPEKFIAADQKSDMHQPPVSIPTVAARPQLNNGDVHSEAQVASDRASFTSPSEMRNEPAKGVELKREGQGDFVLWQSGKEIGRLAVNPSLRLGDLAEGLGKMLHEKLGIPANWNTSGNIKIGNQWVLSIQKLDELQSAIHVALVSPALAAGARTAGKLFGSVGGFGANPLDHPVIRVIPVADTPSRSVSGSIRDSLGNRSEMRDGNGKARVILRGRLVSPNVAHGKILRLHESTQDFGWDIEPSEKEAAKAEYEAWVQKLLRIVTEIPESALEQRKKIEQLKKDGSVTADPDSAHWIYRHPEAAEWLKKLVRKVAQDTQKRASGFSKPTGASVSPHPVSIFSDLMTQKLDPKDVPAGFLNPARAFQIYVADTAQLMRFKSIAKKAGREKYLEVLEQSFSEVLEEARAEVAGQEVAYQGRLGSFTVVEKLAGEAKAELKKDLKPVEARQLENQIARYEDFLKSKKNTEAALAGVENYKQSLEDWTSLPDGVGGVMALVKEESSGPEESFLVVSTFVEEFLEGAIFRILKLKHSKPGALGDGQKDLFANAWDINFFNRSIMQEAFFKIERRLLGASVKQADTIESDEAGSEHYILVVNGASSAKALEAEATRLGDRLDGVYVAGGNEASHSVIFLSGLQNSPVILLASAGDAEVLNQLHEGEEAFIFPSAGEGANGVLAVGPDAAMRDNALSRQKEQEWLEEGLQLVARYPTPVPVGVNLSTFNFDPELLTDADMSGLIRSDRLEPDEEEVLLQIKNQTENGQYNFNQWLRTMRSLAQLSAPSAEELQNIQMDFIQSVSTEAVGNIQKFLGALSASIGRLIRHPFFKGKGFYLRTYDMAPGDSKDDGFFKKLFPNFSMTDKDALANVSGANFYRNTDIGRFLLLSQMAASLLDYARYVHEMPDAERPVLSFFFPMVSGPEDVEFFKNEIVPMVRGFAVWNLAAEISLKGKDPVRNPETFAEAEKRIDDALRTVKFGIMVERLDLLWNEAKMNAVIKDPFISFYRFGTNDLQKEDVGEWVGKGMAGRDSAAASLFYGVLRPRMMQGLHLFITELAKENQSRGQQGLPPKPVCVCGQKAFDAAVHPLIIAWNKMGVPVSVSGSPNKIPRVRHSLLRASGTQPEEIPAVYSKFSELGMDQSAREFMGERLKGAEALLRLVGEFQERYRAQGFYYGQYQDRVEPLTDIGSFRDFSMLKGVLQALRDAVEDPVEKAKLSAIGLGSSPQFSSEELEEALRYLKDRGTVSEKEALELTKSHAFLEMVLQMFLELRKDHPRHFVDHLDLGNLDLFLGVYENRYHPEWLSKAKDKSFDTALLEKRRQEFLSRYYEAVNALFSTLISAVHESLEMVYGTRLVDARKVLDLVLAGQKVPVVAVQRSGTVFDRFGGWIYSEKFSELEIPNEEMMDLSQFVSRYADLLSQDPSAMFRIFTASGARSKSRDVDHISHSLQRALRVAIAKSSVREFRSGKDWTDFWKSDRDISYPLWRMHRFGFFDRFIAHYGTMRNYFPDDGRGTPVHMQTLNAMEFLEALPRKGEDIAFARAMRIQKKLLSEPDDLMTLRMGLFILGIVRSKFQIKTGQVPSKGELQRLIREIFISMGMEDLQGMEQTIAWIIDQERTLSGQELLSLEEIQSAVAKTLESFPGGMKIEEKEKLLAMLYVMIFVMRAGRLDPEKLGMLKRQGPESLLAQWDKFYLAGSNALKQHPAGLLATRVKEADAIVRSGIVEYQSSQERVPLVQSQDSVARDAIIKNNPDLYEKYHKIMCSYYVGLLDPETFRAQLDFFEKLDKAREKQLERVEVLFTPLEAFHNKPYEILVGDSGKDPTLAAVVSRAVFENGFSVESFNLSSAGGDTIVRVIGSFPHGMGRAEINANIHRIEREIKMIRTPSDSVETSRGFWERDWEETVLDLYKKFGRTKADITLRKIYKVYEKNGRGGDLVISRSGGARPRYPTHMAFKDGPFLFGMHTTELLVQTEDRRGLAAFIFDYFLSRGIGILEFNLDDTNGKNLRMRFLLIQKGKSVAAEAMESFLSELEDILNTQTVRVHRVSRFGDFKIFKELSSEVHPHEGEEAGLSIAKSAMGSLETAQSESASSLSKEEQDRIIRELVGEELQRFSAAGYRLLVKRYKVGNDTGLHAGPATNLMKLISQFIARNGFGKEGEIYMFNLRTREFWPHVGPKAAKDFMHPSFGMLRHSPTAFAVAVPKGREFLALQFFEELEAIEEKGECSRVFLPQWKIEDLTSRSEMRSDVLDAFRRVAVSGPVTIGAPMSRALSFGRSETRGYTHRERMIHLLQHDLNGKLMALLSAEGAAFVTKEILKDVVRETLVVFRIFDPKQFEARGGELFIPEGDDHIFAYSIPSARSPGKIYQTQSYGEKRRAESFKGEKLHQLAEEVGFEKIRALFSEEVSQLEQVRDELLQTGELKPELRSRIRALGEKIRSKMGRLFEKWAVETAPVVAVPAKEIKRILVVDDERSVRLFLPRMLKQMNPDYVIDSAEDGQQAWDKLQGIDYDLVVTDLTMPQMGGIQLAREMLKAGKTPAVIFMSGYSSTDLPLEEFKEKGLNVGFLEKPFETEGLKQAIKNISGRSETRAKLPVSETVARPLDMTPEEAAKAEKILILGHQPGQESLTADAMLYTRFIPALLERFPNAKIHIAIDNPNLFSSEQFKGRVFTILDPDYSGKGETPNGILGAIETPRGVIREVLENGRPEGLISWLNFHKYDFVFDFTKCGLGLEEPFLDIYEQAEAGKTEPGLPVVFSNMNPLPDGNLSQSQSPSVVFMLDKTGIQRVQGTENLTRSTRKSKGPVYWEMVLRIYRELGLFKEGIDLQSLVVKLPDESGNRRVQNMLGAAFRQKGFGETEIPPVIRSGRKFVYVNIYSRSYPELTEPAMWVDMLSAVLAKADAYIFFSPGAVKEDQSMRFKMEAVMEQLARRFPDKANRLLKAPENLTVSGVQEFMLGMDAVITSQSGFSPLATDKDVPQIEVVSGNPGDSMWRTFREHSLVVGKGAVLAGDAAPAVEAFLARVLNPKTPPARYRNLGISAEPERKPPEESQAPLFNDALGADDEAMIRMILPMTLKVSNVLKTTVAKDGEEALQKFEAGNFDFVVTDIKMPKMDGLELARRVWVLNRKIPVLLMTGFATAEIKKQVAAWREEGLPVELITKPFSGKDIEEAVKRLAKGASANQSPAVAGSRSELRIGDEANEEARAVEFARRLGITEPLAGRQIFGISLEDFARRKHLFSEAHPNDAVSIHSLSETHESLVRWYHDRANQAEIHDYIMKEARLAGKEAQTQRMWDALHEKVVAADIAVKRQKYWFLFRWAVRKEIAREYQALVKKNTEAAVLFGDKSWNARDLSLAEMPWIPLVWSQSGRYVVDEALIRHLLNDHEIQMPRDYYHSRRISLRDLGTMQEPFENADVPSLVPSRNVPVQRQLPQSAESLRSEIRLAGTWEFTRGLLSEDAFTGPLSVEASQLQAIDSAAVKLGNIFSEKGLGGYAIGGSQAQIRAWIAAQLLKPLRASVERQGIQEEKLRQVLEDIETFIKADRPVAVENGVVKQGLVLHSHMPKLEERVWKEFKLKLPVLLGALVTLRAKLFINIDVDGPAAERMQKEVTAIAAQNGIVLEEQAIVFCSVFGKNPMNSLTLEKNVNGRLAEEGSMVPASERQGSRWLYSKKALSDGSVLATDFTTVLYALMDPRISLSDLHTPSQFDGLFEAVRTAIQAYQSIKQAA